MPSKGRLTAALLHSAHLALFLQELSSPSSSRLNHHRLLSGSLLRRSPPPSLTLYNAQHRAHGQWTELECHKKPIRVPNVSSRQKALRLFSSLHNWRIAAHCCCSLAPPGRGDALQTERKGGKKKIALYADKEMLGSCWKFSRDGHN